MTLWLGMAEVLVRLHRRWGDATTLRVTRWLNVGLLVSGLLYNELRQLAARKLASERPGQTLQPAALVHEAWLRLVGHDDPSWDGRGHFFAAMFTALECSCTNC